MKTLDEALENTLNRVSRLTPHPDYERLIQQDREWRHRQKVDRLREFWNAPRRHVQTKALEATGPWAQTLERLKGRLTSGFLIGLTGIRGNGKTQMAVQLMRHATEQGHSAYYTTAFEMALDVKATFRGASRKGSDDIVEEFSWRRLLVIDEVSRIGGEFDLNLVFQVIDARYRNAVDTLVISNQSREALVETLGPSIASRMIETGGIIECDWPSFREAQPPTPQPREEK